jgi:ubiquitin-protein ligase/DNA-directed RNA polymerase subunit RPC12/RpoP
VIASMIEFKCAGCGRSFIVTRDFVGRRARCKGCGREITVPDPSVSRAAGASNAPLPMRTRRLITDQEQLRVFESSPLIKVTAVDGNPAEIYRVEYHVNSLERGKNDQPVARSHHVVEIRLTSDYPRLAPACKMLTPIFHPNIDPDGTSICIGDHWTAGERLADLIIRIGEMIAYQAYNIRSPLDGEAAMWADLNQSKLPTDPRDLHPAQE